MVVIAFAWSINQILKCTAPVLRSTLQRQTIKHISEFVTVYLNLSVLLLNVLLTCHIVIFAYSCLYWNICLDSKQSDVWKASPKFRPKLLGLSWKWMYHSKYTWTTRAVDNDSCQIFICKNRRIDKFLGKMTGRKVCPVLNGIT